MGTAWVPQVGKSLVEEEQLELAAKLEALAKAKGVQMLLPVDVLAADALSADAKTAVVDVAAIPPDYLGVDNGPETTALIQQTLAPCKTVIWNGPMGVFEFEAFAKGTFAIADSLAEMTGKGCITIIGGGDSVAAVEKAGLGGEARCRPTQRREWSPYTCGA